MYQLQPNGPTSSRTGYAARRPQSNVHRTACVTARTSRAIKSFAIIAWHRFGKASAPIVKPGLSATIWMSRSPGAVETLKLSISPGRKLSKQTQIRTAKYSSLWHGGLTCSRGMSFSTAFRR